VKEKPKKTAKKKKTKRGKDSPTKSEIEEKDLELAIILSGVKKAEEDEEDLNQAL
jgi:hypothetical protein